VRLKTDRKAGVWPHTLLQHSPDPLAVFKAYF